MTLVFLPAPRARARALRSGADLGGWIGYSPAAAANGAPVEADASEEELSYAVLNLAGVAALTDPDNADPLRLVLVADVPADQVAVATDGVGEDPVMAVSLGDLRWQAVRALYCDEPEAAELVEAARHAVRGRSLTAAMITPAVADLLDAHDLLWFDPTELDRLA